MSKLELSNRKYNLYRLMMMTEGFDGGEGKKIHDKCERALEKMPFTGIIRLNIHEKDFIGYMKENSEFYTADEIAALDFYGHKE